ncbi:hypothetical protein VIN01S_22110 [Vibrio inusitatus NBRC 102082]|uniref:Uncharacterized protein n=1 Tax=Vibrio inusitatus NBRC 102082 TaxID=1219070 RepID=A0A4Y3HWG2_9VIBR|nr:glycoside hydrolase family 32 protein [Vibrio inusitatus]GEA51407.1 hypothetical protein VIN01S_22110 [Vibrio inusitatus NBRC 102082]
MNTTTILILLSDLSQIEGHPVMLLSASTPNGKQPQNLCALLTNCANDMNKPLIKLDEVNNALWLKNNGFNEKWRLVVIAIEISHIDMSYRVFGLWKLDAVESRKQPK